MNYSCFHKIWAGAGKKLIHKPTMVDDNDLEKNFFVKIEK